MVKKTNYNKFLKDNPEDIIHTDHKRYYVIRNFEKIENKISSGLFGNTQKTTGKKKKVYIVLRKTGDKSFEEIFKDTSYDKTKSMYNKLRTLNGDNFIVKYKDKKYLFEDVKTGYKFGEYEKTSDLKKAIEDKYENIYKFKNYSEMIDGMVKRESLAKNINKNFKSNNGIKIGKMGVTGFKFK